MARLPDPEMKEIRIDLEGTDEQRYSSMLKGFYGILKGAVGNAEAEAKKKENRKEV